MAQYIDKDALVAWAKETYLYENASMIRKVCYKQLLEHLNTLEVKDVDLEKEINTYISNNFFGSETIGFYANRTKEEPNDQDIALCAKYFFELGLKHRKENRL